MITIGDIQMVPRQISRKLDLAYAISRRYQAMRWARANRESIAAGLGTIGCQLHNSIVGLETGRPWAGVDYARARRAKHLLETQFVSSYIIERYYTRMIREWREAGCP